MFSTWFALNFDQTYQGEVSKETGEPEGRGIMITMGVDKFKEMCIGYWKNGKKHGNFLSFSNGKKYFEKYDTGVQKISVCKSLPKRKSIV